MSLYKPKKPCTYPYCKNLTTEGGRCDEHRRKEARKYDKQRDETPERQFLHSTQWRAIREMKLNSEPLCERCSKRGLTVSAVLVHHINGKELDNEPENLESLCNPCHEDEHKKDRFKR